MRRENRGRESRSLGDALDQAAFSSLDPWTALREERRYRADQTSNAIGTTLYDIVTNQATIYDAANKSGIADENIRAFRQSVHTIQETYNHLSDLVGNRSS